MKRFILMSFFLRRFRSVNDDDSTEFAYTEQDQMTNSTTTTFTVENLKPYTVYSFRVTAINAVGRSKPSKDSYPSVTLMEAPSGKPKVTAAHNTSSTSLYIAWEAPEAQTVHGQFLGYKLTYRPRDEVEAEAEEVPIEDASATVSLYSSLFLLQRSFLDVNKSFYVDVLAVFSSFFTSTFIVN